MDDYCNCDLQTECCDKLREQTADVAALQKAVRNAVGLYYNGLVVDLIVDGAMDKLLALAKEKGGHNGRS